MAKTIVALLVLLLVLAGPAAAQDSESDPPSEEGDPEPSGDPAGGNETADPAPSTQQMVACRVVGTHLLDPRVSPTSWVVPDPDGCFRVIIERVFSPPVTTLL